MDYQTGQKKTDPYTNMAKQALEKVTQEAVRRFADTSKAVNNWLRPNAGVGKVANAQMQQGVGSIDSGGMMRGADNNWYMPNVPDLPRNGEYQQPTPAPTATPVPQLPHPQMNPSQKPNVQGATNILPKEYTRPAAAMPVINNLGRNPEVVKKPAVYKVQSAIESAAKEFGVPASLLYDIGFSEGGFRADAANETPEGQEVGVPRGLFQFTPYTWDTVKEYAKRPGSSLKNFDNADRNDPLQNARAAAYLIKMGQLGRWQASKPNWSRFYTEDEIAPYYAQTEGYEKGKTFK